MVYPTDRAVPLELPVAVKEAYNEALSAFRAGAFNLAVIGFRTSLQMAVREKGGKGANLKAEIDSLEELTPALKEWAHQLRLDANDATHPEGVLPFGKADAEALVGLAESIFDYLYVVPAAVDRRRGQAGPAVQ